MVNKKRGKQNRKSVEFFFTIKICRFEIIDGVKYVYCIKHAYKFLLGEQVGFCGRSLTLASRCFLLCTSYSTCPTVYVNKNLSCLTYGRVLTKGRNYVGTRNFRIAYQLHGDRIVVGTVRTTDSPIALIHPIFFKRKGTYDLIHVIYLIKLDQTI